MVLPAGWRITDPPLTLTSGQAWVHRVRPAQGEDEYALKVLRNVGRSDRFEREIMAMIRLREMGVQTVPQVVEHAFAEGRPYFVTPWYREGSLEAALLTQRWLVEPRAGIDVLAQVARALEEVHTAGYAHRDIKPANVLLDSGSIALADFGLCLQVDPDAIRLTEMDEAVGSRLYIAPENESGINEEVDQRPADFYAFGKMTWAVFAGRHPPAREKHREAEFRLKAVTGSEELARLDPVLDLLATPDPRVRLQDWSHVIRELEVVARVLEALASQSPSPTPRAALNHAQRIRDRKEIRDALDLRDREHRVDRWLRELSERIQRQAQGRAPDLAEISDAAGEAFEITISSGGHALQELWNLQPHLRASGLDPGKDESLHVVGDSSPALFVVQSALPVPLPTLYFPI